MRVAGRFDVDVRHPLTGETVHTLALADGAVATSASTRGCGAPPTARRATTCSIPAPAEPAWTGLIGATALAPTALEAEALAKAALLSGPRRTRSAGCAATAASSIHDDGDVRAGCGA